MREALAEAQKAEVEREVPVGAIVLMNEKIVGRGHNRPIQMKDPTAHAEILALRQASKNHTNYRLPGSILIVTIEPCIMCVGALIQARVEEVIYGAADPKAGALHSQFQIAGNTQLNHSFKVTAGILEEECAAVMKAFFASPVKGFRYFELRLRICIACHLKSCFVVCRDCLAAFWFSVGRLSRAARPKAAFPMLNGPHSPIKKRAGSAALQSRHMKPTNRLKRTKGISAAYVTSGETPAFPANRRLPISDDCADVPDSPS
jgi:tRNA(adenine34) deaminase